MIGFQTDVPELPIAEEIEKGKTALDAFKGLSFDDALAKLANGLVSFGFKLLIAILVFYVGRFIIRKLYHATHSVMVSRRVDASLITFVLSLVNMLLYFILIVTIIGILGLETSSFLALFASAGVAIGMALSGTLQNFAGGVLILLLKPYKVGDYIETQGYTGTVKAIQIFNTIINTVDNKAIIIPNGGLSTGTINNYSLEDYRRVEWSVGLAYGTDYAKAREYILDMLLSDARVVKKYIEDDREFRARTAAAKGLENKDCEQHPEACEDNATAISSKKLGWWARYRMNRRKNRILAEEQLDKQESINAGLPTRVARAPFVGLNQLADSSINLVVRVWTHSDNFWPLYFEMNERFYKELPEQGFEFPFPQMDVHLNHVDAK